MTARPLPRARADALAKALDLDLDVGICHACLSFVSLALAGGDPKAIVVCEAGGQQAATVAKTFTVDDSAASQLMCML